MTDGIVPDYMSKDWQRMRSNLRIVAAHAMKGAEASTIEEVRRNIGAASMGLIDADFLRRTIERAEHRDD